MINTSGKDMYPYIFENNTLYFASDGHPGLGGMDLFESTWDGEKWSEPKNLKPPMNSSGDDFSIGMYRDRKTKNIEGHFASNRSDNPGKTDDNLFSFNLLPLEFTLSGTVYWVEKNEAVANAEVTLNIIEEESGEPLTVPTNEEGKYFYELEPEKDYTVKGNKEGFFASQVKEVSTVGYELSENFIRDLYIKKIPPSEIKLEGIYYGLDSFNLRKSSLTVLDSLYDILTQNPTLVIELASHTDCRATYDYNEELSQKRADTVVKYLTWKGIDRERMEPKGYGESKLVNDCACEGGSGKGRSCTEEEHQANRRTTFRVLRADYKPKDAIEEEEIKTDEEKEQEEEEKEDTLEDLLGD